MVGPWKWLEELRFRFDLAIEVVDRDLEFVLAPASGRAVDIRAAIGGRLEPPLKDVASAVLRAAKARSVTEGGLRMRLFPLFGGIVVPRAISGLLLLADRLPAIPGVSGAPEGQGEPHNGDAIEELDRRLDAAGQWLAGAIEASIDTAAASTAQAHAAQRLRTILDVVDLLSRIQNDRELIKLTVDAVALWYDADVRAYRQDFTGGFALDVWLAGADLRRAPRRLPGEPIWERDEVFRLESPREVEEFGWDARLTDTLFAPIHIDDSPEWLLTVSGASDDTVQATLGFLRQILGRLVTGLERDTADRLRKRLTAIFAMGNAPFDATVRLALESIGHEINAAGCRLAIYYDGRQIPAVLLASGDVHPEPPSIIDPGVTVGSPRQIAVGTVAGAGVTAVLDFRAGERDFSTAAARLVKASAEIIGSWLSGTFLLRGDVGRRAPGGDPSSDLLERLQAEVDQTGRLKPGGSLAVMIVDSPAKDEALLKNVAQVIREQVRSSDIIGLLSDTGAGALLSDVTPEMTTSIVERLWRAAERRVSSPVRVGSATADPSSESPEALLARALADARRRPALS